MVPSVDSVRADSASLTADASSNARLLRVLSSSGPRVIDAIARAEELRLQILVTDFASTRCTRGSNGVNGGGVGPAFTAARTGGFRVNHEYLYPASTIKLPTALCVLRALQELQCAGVPVTARTPLRFHPAFPDQSVEDRDETNLGYVPDDVAPEILPACPPGVICLEHEIRKSLIVSDNPAHNRLYNFVGHERVNTLCRELGLGSTIINHRLGEFRSREEQRRTCRVDFLEHPHTSRERVVATIPARTSSLIIDNPPALPGLHIGQAHVVDNFRVESPMDFSWRNRHALDDMQRVLMMLVRPELMGDPSGLIPRHRELLCDALWPMPRQSSNPRFDADQHSDASNKYVGAGRASSHLRTQGRIYNKVGRAYGFTLDNAYLTTPNFFLAIGLYTNPGGVLGDDSYAYAPAIPLIARIASALAASSEYASTSTPPLPAH